MGRNERYPTQRTGERIASFPAATNHIPGIPVSNFTKGMPTTTRVRSLNASTVGCDF